MKPCAQNQGGYNGDKLARIQGQIEILSGKSEIWNVISPNDLDMSYDFYGGEHFNYGTQHLSVVHQNRWK
jgi:hypothetical protein